MKTVVKIEVDGVSVTGKIISRKSYRLIVEITSPFSGFTNTAYIEPSATQNRSFLKEYGDESAGKLLEDLYRTCLYIHNNIEEVKLMHAHLLMEKKKIWEQIEIYHTKEKGIKEAFEHGTLTEKDCQQEMKLIREKKLPYWQQLHDLHAPSLELLNYIKPIMISANKLLRINDKPKTNVHHIEFYSFNHPDFKNRRLLSRRV